MSKEGEYRYAICVVERHGENNEPPPINKAGAVVKRQPLSDEKIKDLAKKMYKNEIFTSMQLDSHSLVSSVFMPLMLMDEIAVMDFKKNNIAHLYSYIDDHCGRSVNGYPTFHTIYTLTMDEAEKVCDKWKQITEMMEGI